MSETDMPKDASSAIRLSCLPGRFAICRLPADAEAPRWAQGRLVSFTRTDEGLSVVCEQSGVPTQVQSQRDYAALEVEGPLDFSLTGILASLTAPLAQAGVPVFSLSTYHTDYLLIPGGRLGQAVQALRGSGVRVGVPSESDPGL